MMKTANTTTSEIHGIVAEATGEPPAKYAALAVKEKGGESDDEYEVVPARQKKARPIEDTKPAKKVTEERASQPVEDVDMSEKPMEEQAVQDTTTSTEIPAQPTATDDDWLRSRTNRLLDLVDDEDVIPVADPPKEVHSTIPDEEEQVEPEVVDATIDEDQEMKDQDQEPEQDGADPESKEDDVDTVRKTRRLFVRNLPYSATEDDLKSYFKRYGDVEEVRHIFLNFGVSFL